MKKIVPILSLLLTSLSSFADFNGVNVDLVKYRQMAKDEFQRQGLPSEIKELLFQDAAFATDTHALFDGSMLLTLGREIKLDGGMNKFRLAYRILPQSGQSAVILVQLTSDITRVILPDALFLVFPNETSKDQIDQNLKKIFSLLGENEYQYTALGNLKRIVIDLKNPSVPNYLNLVRQITKSDIKARFGFNFEKYRTPFEFGVLQNISQQKSVDLDKLRDVIPKYLKAGKKFTTSQSKIPAGIVVD